MKDSINFVFSTPSQGANTFIYQDTFSDPAGTSALIFTGNGVQTVDPSLPSARAVCIATKLTAEIGGMAAGGLSGGAVALTGAHMDCDKADEGGSWFKDCNIF